MEQNTANNPNGKTEVKKAKTGAKAKPGFSSVVADHKAEFKKIIWPKKDEVAKKTVTVIVTSLLIGFIIFCMDTAFMGAQDLAMSLLGLI
ncbi:MAG TPA: preprotein translocase subunit SecE [Lachnospiraceae bacterium]|nr:preprotein translocase subunit SecE [Lachnospiraceae bacterium]